MKTHPPGSPPHYAARLSGTWRQSAIRWLAFFALSLSASGPAWTADLYFNLIDYSHTNWGYIDGAGMSNWVLDGGANSGRRPENGDILHFDGFYNLSQFSNYGGNVLDYAGLSVDGITLSPLTDTYRCSGDTTLTLNGDLNARDAWGAVILDFTELRLAKTSTWSLNQDFTVNSVISGPGGLDVTTGYLTLNGTNTFTGKVHVDFGEVQIASDSALGAVPSSFVADSITLSTYGRLSNSGTTPVTVGANRGILLEGENGGIISGPSGLITVNSVISGTQLDVAGQVELAAANTYAGDTIVRGVVRLSHANAIPSASNIMLSGGTLVLTAASGDFTRELGAGPGQVQFNGKDSNGTFATSGGFSAFGSDRSVNLGGNATPSQVTWGSGYFVGDGCRLELSDEYSADHTIDFRNPIAQGSMDREVWVRNGSAGLDARLSGVLSGAGGLTKNGAGTLELSAANTFTGDLVISEGTVILSGGSALADTVRIRMEKTWSQILREAQVTLAADETIGSLERADDANVTATIDLGGHSLTTGTDNTSTKFTGTILGAGSLVKVGSGTMELRGNNAFTGATVINGGMLSINSSSNLGDATNDISLNGGTLRITGTSVGSVGCDVTLNAGGGTLDIDDPGHSVLWQGDIGGAGALTKTGPGTLRLTTIIDHRGGTLVNEGTLEITGDDKLGRDSGTLTLDGGRVVLTSGTDVSARDIVIHAGGGTLENVGGNATWTLNGAISGSGRLIKSGSGRLVLTAAYSYAGGTTISGGTLEISSATNLGLIPASPSANNILLDGGTIYASGSVTTANRGVQLGAGNGEFSTKAGITLTVHGGINGAGRLIKSGAGILYLGGANSYEGGTSIDDGTLTLGSADALGISGSISFGGGTLQFSAANSSDYSSRFSAAAGQIVRVDTNGRDVTFGTGLSNGEGSLTKLGAGTLTLAGDFTDAGEITVNAGTLNQPGGSLLAMNGLTVGKDAGSDGTYALGPNGGLMAGLVTVGLNGSGRIEQDGGMVHVMNGIAIGSGVGSNGSYTTTGSDASLRTMNLNVGGLGTAAFHQNGGTVEVALGMQVASDSGTALYEITSGTLAANMASLSLGAGGTLRMKGGLIGDTTTRTVIANTLVMGGVDSVLEATGFNNVLRVNQIQNRPSNFSFVGALQLGQMGGLSEMTIGASQQVSAMALVIGYDGDSTVTLNTGGSLDTNGLEIGRMGSGQLVHNGGTVAVHGLISLGQNWVQGNYTQSGGTLAAGDALMNVGDGGTGAFTISGGIAEVGSVQVGGAGSGTFGIDGGLVKAASFHVDVTGSLSGTSGELRANALTFDGASLSLTGNLSIGHDGGAGSGQATLAAGKNLTSNYLAVGYNAAATFTQTGGNNTATSSLRVASETGSQGTYTMSGGQFNAANTVVGRYGNGTFVQSGGTHALTTGLFLSYYVGSYGSYSLGGTGILQSQSQYIGEAASGLFTQTGGSNTASQINLGYEAAGSGQYTLSGGSLSAGSLYAGYFGRGTFTQSGGTNTISNILYLANSNGSAGTYNLQGGGMMSTSEYVGYRGAGEFVQSGGTNGVSGTLYLGGSTNGNGTYRLSDSGQLHAANVQVGYGSTGAFYQSGGTQVVDVALTVGVGTGKSGIFNLSGGTLTTGGLFVGNQGNGQFLQSGGTAAATNITLGVSAGSNGTYEIGGGTLSVGTLWVGRQGSGTLNINYSSSHITVSNTLKFGGNGSLSAVAGSAIHMTGSAFVNESIDPSDLADMENLRMVFEGGAADLDPFEVAGRGFGAIAAGFDLNFALGTLELGGADIGRVQLVNNFDNQPSWVGSEALYVWNLVIHPGSTLDLNGCDLYYGTFAGDLGSISFNGGSFSHVVPEPATCALLLTATAAALAISRRREKVLPRVDPKIMIHPLSKPTRPFPL